MATFDLLPNDDQASLEPFKPRDSIQLISEDYVEKAMPAILGNFDMIALYIMIIFFITQATAVAGGGAAGFTYLGLGAILFFLPCVVATAQLGVLFPHEGSLYNWTHKAFGSYWGFFVAFCAWFPGVLVMISCSDTVVGLVSGLNGTWLQQPWQQGLVISALLAVTGFVATRRFRSVQHVINIIVVLIFCVVFLLLLAMLVYLASGGRPQTAFANPANWAIYFSGKNQNINLFGIITLSYLGVEIPMILGGEIVGSGGRRSKARGVILGHLFWGTLLVFVGYGIATLALLVIEGPVNGSLPMALVMAIGQELGAPMAYVAVIIIMAFFAVNVIVYNMVYARLLMVASIDKHLPKGGGMLNQYRVPSKAIRFQTLMAIAITLLIFVVIPLVIHLPNVSAVILSLQVYDVIQSSVTIVWAISTLFLFINLLRFMYKDRDAFARYQLFPRWILLLANALGIVGSFASIVGTLLFSWLLADNVGNSQWTLIVGGSTITLLLISIFASMLASGQASWEKISSAV